MADRQELWRSLSAPLGVLALVLALTAAVGRAGADRQEALLAEGGPIETLSALGYVVVAALLVWRMGFSRDWRAWPLAGVLLALVGREIDLDKRGFTEGLLKSRQYLGGDVPPAERLLSIALLAALLSLLTLTWRRYGRQFLQALGQGRQAAILIALGITLAALTKSIDGLERKLAGVVTLPDGTDQALAPFEEIGELGIPLAFLLAALATHQRQPAGVSHRDSVERG